MTRQKDDHDIAIVVIGFIVVISVVVVVVFIDMVQVWRIADTRSWLLGRTGENDCKLIILRLRSRLVCKGKRMFINQSINQLISESTY